MTNTAHQKLRLGLLLDSYCVPAWTYHLIKRIVESDYAAIQVVLLNDAPRPKTDMVSRLKENAGTLLYRIYTRIERRLFRPQPNAFALMDVSELLADVPEVRVKPRQTKFSDWIEEDDVARIKEFNLDVMVLRGFRILRGGVLHAAKHGVWSYHHGDNRHYRGSPSGFWEVFEHNPVVGSVVQIISEQLDAGLVIDRSYSATDHLSVTRCRNNYFWKSVAMLPRTLQQLHKLGPDAFDAKVKEMNATPDIYAGRLYKAPGNVEFAWLFVKHLLSYIKTCIYRLCYAEPWTLSLGPADALRGSIWKFKQLTPPKQRFWADPFVVYRGDKHYIFFEDFSYETGKGYISVIARDESGQLSEPVKALERPYHLSYPFLFEWDGTYYMIPDTSSNESIELYRCKEFPHRWVFDKTIMDDIKAVDATLVEHDNKWWMFVNIKEYDGASYWDELYVFHADSPLADTWHPHAMNPVVSDARKARPGGAIFRENGSLLRPGQDSSRCYGYGLSLNEITELTETSYAERQVQKIEPTWDKRVKGVHTINHAHGLTVIDAKTKRFRLG